jgi:methyl-galactoside transport system substrate-binding protein
MKKWFCVLISIVMLLELTACGASSGSVASEQPTSPVVSTGATSAQINKSDFIVDAFMYDTSNTFAGAQFTILLQRLSELGVKYNSYDGGGTDQAKQTDQIRSAIAKGSNFLIVCPAAPDATDAMQELVDIAKTAGIPIEFFLRKPDNSVMESYDQAMFIGSEEYAAGVMQANILWNIMGDNLKAFDLNNDGKLTYLMLYGQLGHDAAINRTKASVATFNDYLSKAGWPPLEFYDPNNTDKFLLMNWDIATALNVTATALQTNPMDGPNPIEMVISNNDDGAVGAVQALQQVGWNTGEEGKPWIPVVGVDASYVVYDYLINNQIQGTVKQNMAAMIDGLIVLLERNSLNGKLLLTNVDSILTEKGWKSDDGGHYIVIPFEPFSAEDAVAALQAAGTPAP